MHIYVAQVQPRRSNGRRSVNPPIALYKRERAGSGSIGVEGQAEPPDCR